jgi:hypothetical protein
LTRNPCRAIDLLPISMDARVKPAQDGGSFNLTGACSEAELFGRGGIVIATMQRDEAINPAHTGLRACAGCRCGKSCGRLQAVGKIV